MDSMQRRGARLFRLSRSRSAAALVPALGLAGLALAAVAPTETIPIRGPAGNALEAPAENPQRPFPEKLSQTGLFLPGNTTTIAPGHLEYSPQYPLWSDGASKRRWIHLPEGQHIDGSDPDHFRFPPGTRFYKEFSFGARVETRLLEVSDSGVSYATYVWNPDGSDAILAPETGLRGIRTVDDGLRYDAPSQSDCGACHGGRGARAVLGFDALQLSSDRDPLAAHQESAPKGAVDLPELVRRDLIRNLPWQLIETPPALEADTALERAARGYMYGNCAHCHNGEGALAPLGLDLDAAVGIEARARQRSALIGAASRFVLPGMQHSLRVAPGAPRESVLACRMGSLSPVLRMPPLGTRRVDVDGLRLIEDWITEVAPSSSL